MARKGDGLYLRGKTWYLDFRHDGVRHTFRIGKGVSRSVAGEIASVKRAQVLRGEVGIRKKKDISFDRAKDAFVKWTQANKRPRTQHIYLQQLERLADSFSTKTLRQISTFDVERHKRLRVEAGARVVVNRELALLKNLFNRAKLWGLYEGENPVVGVKFLEEPQRRLRYLEPGEEARLLEVSGEPLRSLIVIGVNTGIRIGAEALTLKWSDVDLARGILTVQAAYSKNGKTRTIPLNSRAKAAFQHLKATRRSEYVFTKPNGLPYESMERPFTIACEAGGLAGTGATLHTLRHTFARRLVMAGVDLRTIQEYGGWTDLSLVQRYSHLNPEHKARAIERIGDLFHNAFHNTSVSAEVVPLADRRATM